MEGAAWNHRMKLSAVTTGTGGRIPTVLKMASARTGDVRTAIGVSGSACFFCLAAIIIDVLSTPPVLTRRGRLIVYHGVSEIAEPGKVQHQLCYSAGVMVLSKEHPRVIRYRTPEPVLTPALAQERSGTVANVSCHRNR